MKKITILLAILLLLVGCTATPDGATGQPKSEMVLADMIKALSSESLPIGKVEEYTADTDPNSLLGRPGQYIQKANWADSRIEFSDENLDGGTIEVFKNEKDAKKRLDYIVKITDGTPMLQTYNYLNGKYMMRLNLGLTPDQAKEYEDIFNSLTK